jgi:hypothetical protein
MDDILHDSADSLNVSDSTDVTKFSTFWSNLTYSVEVSAHFFKSKNVLSICVWANQFSPFSAKCGEETPDSDAARDAQLFDTRHVPFPIDG